jgi:hypothetical protein
MEVKDTEHEYRQLSYSGPARRSIPELAGHEDTRRREQRHLPALTDSLGPF